MATQLPSSSPEPRPHSTPLQHHPSLLHQQRQLYQQQQQQAPYSLPTSPEHFNSNINNGHLSGGGDMASDMPPPPHPGSTSSAPFTSFFTLIQDGAAHFHPTVHYIFSDDDFDPVASHAEQLAAEEAAAQSDSNSNSISGSNGVVDDVDGDGGSYRRRKKQRERIVVVDVAPDGEGIVNARSLSRDWQVVGVKVTNAPTWMAEDGGGGGAGRGDHPGGGVGPPPERSPSAASGASAHAVAVAPAPTRPAGEAGLMLTIEGMGQLDKVKAVESLDELAMMFNERMDSLRRVINFAEKAPPLQD